MELVEITDLIEIRNYVVAAVNNYSISRDKVSQLNEMLLLIDKRIVDKILSDDFKNLLGYQDVKAIVSEARKISNIKSGLKTI